MFDPRQLPTLDLSIEKFTAIKTFQNPSPTLLEEWLIYLKFKEVEVAIPNPLDLTAFWESLKGRFPALSKIASEAMLMAVTSVDVERSFSTISAYVKNLKGKPYRREHQKTCHAIH